MIFYTYRKRSYSDFEQFNSYWAKYKGIRKYCKFEFWIFIKKNLEVIDRGNYARKTIHPINIFVFANTFRANKFTTKGNYAANVAETICRFSQIQYINHEYRIWVANYTLGAMVLFADLRVDDNIFLTFYLRASPATFHVTFDIIFYSLFFIHCTLRMVFFVLPSRYYCYSIQ